VILDTASFWRCHLTLKDPVVGKASEAKPKELKKGELHWNSEPPPAGWVKPEFDDGHWWRSPGPFYGGYGDARGYVAAPDTIGLICLRGKFGVDDPAKIKSLTFSATYRGGIVVYLNGKEVKRAHLPDGAITAETPAEEYPKDAYLTPEGKIIRWGWGDPGKYADRCELRIRKVSEVVVPTDGLRKGMNVLAVEVHRSPYAEGIFGVGNWWDGFRCHVGLNSVRLGTTSPEAVTANVSRPKGFQVWNANPMMAIFDMDYGDPTEDLHPIYIAGARNAAFSGQVVISSDETIKGLKAEIGDLVLAGGKGGKIASSAVQVRYAKPGGLEGGSDGRYGTNEVSRFDALDESAPAEVPVYKKARGRAPFGAVQPVWVTVNVPADAAAGEYEGKLTVRAEGQKDTTVPVRLVVSAFKLPDPRENVTFVDMIQSPESVALYYGVPLWSDRHWALIDKTFQQLGRIGNKTVYIPLICKTHFGNSESMVRRVKAGDGAHTGDFTIMEKYLDIAEKHLGKPPVVVFYVWDHFSGGGYFGGAVDPTKVKKTPVSLLDPEKKELSTFEGPTFLEQEAEAFWKPIADELLLRMKKRGLEKSVMLGIGSDVRPGKEVVELWKKLLPDAQWVLHTHGLDSRLHGVPVGYCATVWKAGYAKDPEVGYTYGWQRKELVAQFQRDLVFGWALTQNRLLPENNIGGNQRGFGRNGADFWPPFKNDKGQRVGSLAGRYPESGWAQLSLKTCFLAPGPEGALSTVRWEMTCEGVNECEARIFIEKALLDKALRAKLGEERAGKLQTMLDKRIRAGLWGAQNYGWYVSSGWQKRSEELFVAAAEVAGVLGK
jgi:hypothetical protein